ncbi:MAG: hypothetical protein Q4A37_02580 [Candidatus Saccharibacteria bacterium]|nr:hypothetical protein [Candidatus Saccharibacteria bacterium]
MTLLSRSPDIQRLDTIAKERTYHRSSLLARAVLGGVHNLLLGNVDFEVIGSHNLLNAVESAVRRDTGIIVGADHLNNMSVPATAMIAGQVTDVIVPVASTNYDDPLQRAVYSLAGVGRGGLTGVTYPVPYEMIKDQSGQYIKPKPFSADHYDGLIDSITSGRKAVVAAVHNPTQGSANNDGRLPKRPGLLVPHLSLVSGLPVLPSLLQVEGQIRNPNQLNDNKLHLSWVLGKKAARLTIGESIAPSSDDCGRYRELMQSPKSSAITAERQRLLQLYGDQILQWMRDSYDESFGQGGSLIVR